MIAPGELADLDRQMAAGLAALEEILGEARDDAVSAGDYLAVYHVITRIRQHGPAAMEGLLAAALCKLLREEHEMPDHA